MPVDIRKPGKLKLPPKSQKGRLKAAPALSAAKGLRTTKEFASPIRSRRRFAGYQLEDPDESRAVSESVHPGTILERIIYKRNLVLYGPPGPTSWTTQLGEFGPGNVIGGIRLDFVYWLTRPPLALEPQGLHWHSPFEAYSDAARAFIVRGLGYRYAEIFEDEILSTSDEHLDRRIQDLVGGRIAVWQELWRFEPDFITGIIRSGEPFKSEQRRRL